MTEKTKNLRLWIKPTASIFKLFQIRIPIAENMSMSASPKSANEVQAKLKELYKCIKQIEDARKGSSIGLHSITATHNMINNDQKISPSNRISLIQKCEDAIQDAEKEEDCLRKSLEKIYDIRKIRHEIRMQARSAGNKETIRRGALMKMLATSAETIPLWVGREHEPPPPLCGAVPSDANYAAQPGDMVSITSHYPSYYLI